MNSSKIRKLIWAPLWALFFVATLASVNAQSSITGSYDFSWEATKNDDGISLSGSVPSESIQRFLAIRAGEGATIDLNIARGAPDTFISSSIAGLDALKKLDQGQFSIRDDVWSLHGTASNQNLKDDILSVLTLAVDTSDWQISIDVASAATADSPEPTSETNVEMAPSFRWMAQKTADGSFRFSGNVPSDELGDFLALRAKNVSRDTTQTGPETPTGFMTSALVAIRALHELDTGRVVFSNSTWTLNGLAVDQNAKEQSLTELSNVAKSNDWAIYIDVKPHAAEPVVATVEEPEPPTEPAEPTEPTEPVEPAEPAANTALNTDYEFNALRADGGQISIGGNLPGPAFQNYLSRVFENTSIQTIEYDTDTPENFRINVITGLRALAELRSGLLAYDNGVWTLVGDALDNPLRADVRQRILALKDSENWKLDIVTVPALEICEFSVAQFSETKTILFAPASARLTSESEQNVRELAQNLNACSNAIVYVAGHTDADGPADANMALSVSRAEAVVATLIEAGVSDSRLYAVGYGETLPIASNDTRAGKAQNRRIVFELSTE